MRGFRRLGPVGGCQIGKPLPRANGCGGGADRAGGCFGRRQLQAIEAAVQFQDGSSPRIPASRGSPPCAEAAVLQIENPSSWASTAPSNSIAVDGNSVSEGHARSNRQALGRDRGGTSPKPLPPGSCRPAGPGRPKEGRRFAGVGGRLAIAISSPRRARFRPSAAGPRPGQAPKRWAPPSLASAAVHPRPAIAGTSKSAGSSGRHTGAGVAWLGEAIGRPSRHLDPGRLRWPRQGGGPIACSWDETGKALPSDVATPAHVLARQPDSPDWALPGGGGAGPPLRRSARW